VRVAGAAEAHALGALLQGHRVVLNLIPWNPVLASADSEGKAPAPMRFAAPRSEDVAAFQRILRDEVSCVGAL
jgi:adenine C2-methylase RlmN of 23S rRNA A2503 and tRNA A37